MSLYTDFKNAQRQLKKLTRDLEAAEAKAEANAIVSISEPQTSDDSANWEIKVNYGKDATPHSQSFTFPKAMGAKPYYIQAIRFDKTNNTITQTFEDADGNSVVLPSNVTASFTLPYAKGQNGADSEYVVRKYEGHTWSTDYKDSKAGKKVYYAPDGKTKQWSASATGDAGKSATGISGDLTMMSLGVKGVSCSFTLASACFDVVWNAISILAMGGSVCELRNTLGARTKMNAAVVGMIPLVSLIWAIASMKKGAQNSTFVSGLNKKSVANN